VIGWKGVCSVCQTEQEVEPSLLLAANIINGDKLDAGAGATEELFVIAVHPCAGSGTTPASVSQQ